jgi:hypothetical protein
MSDPKQQFERVRLTHLLANELADAFGPQLAGLSVGQSPPLTLARFLVEQHGTIAPLVTGTTSLQFLQELKGICEDLIEKHSGDRRAIDHLFRYAVSRHTGSLLRADLSDEEIGKLGSTFLKQGDK